MTASEVHARLPAAATLPGGAPRARLVGREAELAALDGLVDRLAGGSGGAVVVHGEPGIGKSSLAAAATERARSRTVRVLSTQGVQSEARLPFAGLHRLLAPVLDLAPALPPGQREALLAAFGMVTAPPPELFLVGLATLELVGESADRSRTLLVVEDAHWLDDPSGAVLGFVARRLATEPVAMVITTRHRHDGPLDTSALPQLALPALDDAAAGALLDAGAPSLAAPERERVLDAAAGNPLALIELSASLPAPQENDAGTLPRRLALPERLERAFAGAAAALPDRTRSLLLVASAADDDLLDDTLRAAALVVGDTMTAADLDPAIGAQLVSVDGARLHFRHPLVRSAIYQAAGMAERQAAHAALADALADRSDRRAWHRAAATLGTDEDVAAELDAVADDAIRRGAVAVAVAAYERAAELSERSSRRANRLLRAAETAFALGHTASGTRLLRAADGLALGAGERARLGWLRTIHQERGWSRPGPGSVEAAVAALRADGHGDLVPDLLLKVARACWWGQCDAATGQEVVRSVERLADADDDPTSLAARAFADPVGQASFVLGRIARLSPDASQPAAAFLLGTAAGATWSFDVALPFLGAAVDGLRAQGRVGLLAQALATQAWAAAHLAREQLAISAAEEAVRLGAETEQHRCVAAARLAQALIAAERGDQQGEAAITGEIEAQLVAGGGSSMLALVHFVRGRGAVAHQRYAEGIDHLERLLQGGDRAHHPHVGAWALADLVEAGAHTARHEHVADHLQRLTSLAAATSGSLLLAEASYARAVVADGDHAEALFRAAIDRDLASWPCYRARMLLWYGRWLRRRRRVADSRTPLRLAREGFDALCFPTLAEIARQELRASGEASGGPVHAAWDQLTPQELQIAQLAAEGLTNRQIGEKLFISHRTVAFHLHRIFPKLGITSRNQLHATLGDPGGTSGTPPAAAG